MPHSDSRLRLAPFMKPPPFLTSPSADSDSTRSAVVESISRMLIVAFDWTMAPPMPRKPAPVLSMLNLSMPPSRMYLTPRILPTLAAEAGSTAPDAARPCSFNTSASLSRSTTENLSESILFSEKAVSIVLRAAGPISLWNHHEVAAWFSNSQIAILIFACAKPEAGSARTRATVAARHRTVVLMMHLLMTSFLVRITGQQHGHVVAPVQVEGRLNQPVGRLSEIGLFLQRLLYRVVANHTVEAVRAHHQGLAVLEIELVYRDVKLEAGAHHVGEHVVHRMLFERRGIHARFLAEHGHPRIVPCELSEFRTDERIEPAVADAGEGQMPAFHERHDDRRAHAIVLGVLLAGTEDLPVGDLDGVEQTVLRHRQRRVQPVGKGDVGRQRALAQELLRGVDRDARRHLARVVAAHAVGDRHQRQIRIPEDRVFVRSEERRV